MIDLNKLEALAKATEPFEDDYEAGYWDEHGEIFHGLVDATAFIQAANPQAILEMIAELHSSQLKTVSTLFHNKLAALIIEPLANEGHPRAQFWMAGFRRGAEATDNQSGWIPVSERTPENHKHVLVSLDEHQDVIVAYWCECGDESEWSWYKPDSDEQVYNVIAWQPLPQAYEASNE